MMEWQERLKALNCIVVIPTYNNNGTIAKVIADVKMYAPDVMVVNDGSTDDTEEIISKIDRINIISYKKIEVKDTP